VQRLQIQLLHDLGGDEFHRRTLHRFGDGLRVVEVVLLPFGIGPHIFRGHQPGIVTERPELATEVMRPDAGFHADQARRHIRQPAFHLAA